jgi:hypothetical protein
MVPPAGCCSTLHSHTQNRMFQPAVLRAGSIQRGKKDRHHPFKGLEWHPSDNFFQHVHSMHNGDIKGPPAQPMQECNCLWHPYIPNEPGYIRTEYCTNCMWHVFLSLHALTLPHDQLSTMARFLHTAIQPSFNYEDKALNRLPHTILS